MTKTYLFSLENGNAIFDEKEFTDLEEGKKWAAGRGKYYDFFNDRYSRYRVNVYILTNEPFMPLEIFTSYMEE